MTQAFAASGRNAKNGVSENCSDISNIATFPTIHESLTAFFERLKPKKTWALIAATLGLKEHTAKHRAANHTSYSIEELQVLLHGNDGREILDLLMETASPIPDWWVQWCKTWELSAIRAEQSRLQQRAMALDNTPMDRPARRKLKAFADADRNISAIRAEKETAEGLLHQDVSRAVDRSVVAATAKAKIPAAGMRAGGRR